MSPGGAGKGQCAPPDPRLLTQATGQHKARGRPSQHQAGARGSALQMSSPGELGGGAGEGEGREEWGSLMWEGGWMRNSIPETAGDQGERGSFCPLCSLFADAENETTAATPFLREAQPRSSEDRRESCPLPQPPCHESGGALPTPARVLLWLPTPLTPPPHFCPAPGALPPALTHLGCYRDPAGQVRARTGW